MKKDMRKMRMNTRTLLAIFVFASINVSIAWAQDMGSMQPSGMTDMTGMNHGAMHHANMPEMDHSTMKAEDGELRDPYAYSDGYTLDSGQYVLTGHHRLHLADEHNVGSILFNTLERVHTDDGNATAYDLQAWYGRNYNRLVVKAEGDVASGKLQEARTEVLWGHAIASYWDAQLGLRHDSGVAPKRDWLALGVQGMAPYWFEVDAAAYVGENGRTALRLSMEYELLFTQKLILQPTVEANLYGKSDLAREIGSGLSDISAGLRLRYEFTRQFAPYVGIEWSDKFGETADIVHAAGMNSSEKRWVAGLRFWF